MTKAEVVDPDEVDEPDEGALAHLEPTADLVPYQRPPVLPGADEFGHVMMMAEALSKSNLVPKGCVGKPGDIAIVMLAARDLGVPITQAFAKIHVIEGKLSLSAEMMIALALRDGHRVWCEELTAKSATACAQRKGTDYIARFTFTIEDAETAGLLGKDNWKHYPKSMLWARAASGVVRMHLPDVVAGITYVPEEIGDDEHWFKHPASALDPSIREEFVARIDALPTERKDRLREEWKNWGLAAPARLTAEEEPVVRELLDRAEAIDVPSTDGTTTTGAEPEAGSPGPSDPDPGNGPDPGTEGHTDDPGAADKTPDVAPPVDPPDVDPPPETQPGAVVGEIGHCGECGGPVYVDTGGVILHGDEDDAVIVGSSTPHAATLAGPEVDVDALYGHAHPKPLDSTALITLISAEVGAMSSTKILKALRTAEQSVNGTPKECRERWLEHRIRTEVGVSVDE